MTEQSISEKTVPNFCENDNQFFPVRISVEPTVRAQ